MVATRPNKPVAICLASGNSDPELNEVSNAGSTFSRRIARFRPLLTETIRHNTYARVSLEPARIAAPKCACCRKDAIFSFVHDLAILINFRKPDWGVKTAGHGGGR
ncbi:hypothetical protein [Salipiger mucosus]|uniref:hypothetical protein n=1 Tax=Salipiger mucosus TaxID=263378 RepID=UPI0012EB1D96|nr:hypothetical protein [Salipiger mucosus]